MCTGPTSGTATRAKDPYLRKHTRVEFNPTDSQTKEEAKTYRISLHFGTSRCSSNVVRTLQPAATGHRPENFKGR